MFNHAKNHWQEKLERAVKKCADHLRNHEAELKARGQSKAATTAIAMADITDTTLALLPTAGSDALKLLLVAADIHALRQGNGLGDIVIWPAYRQTGMHRVCEEWSTLTNIVREIRQTLMDAVLV